MKSLFVVLFAAAYASTFLEPLTDGSNCDSSLTGFTVSDFSISPSSPKKGSPVSVTMTGTNNSGDSIGDAELQVYWNGIHFDDKTVSVNANCSGSSCTLGASLDVPSISPSGHYKVNAYVHSNSGSNLCCWSFSFDL